MSISKEDQVKKISRIKAALAGRCQFEKILGEGFFGIVVHANHKLTFTPYAIKMMDCDSDQQIKYQRRELGLLTKLQLSDRTSIIQYFESWVSKIESENVHILCIQMELCWGGLDTFILENNLGPGPSIVKVETFYKHIFPQILNGLDVIHSAGWMHRDIHLANLLIALPEPSRIQDIVIKIADFGLARQYERSACLTAQPTLEKLSPKIGNKFFRAPELSTENYSEKVDLYSAGIVLYLLCCYVPNKDRWFYEIEALKAGRRGRQDLCHKDEMLYQLLLNLLNHNPDKRPSAREALEEFPLTKTDGGVNAATTSTSGVIFLAKKEGEVAYNRCYLTDRDSLSGVKVAVENGIGISRGNQVLRQVSDVDGVLININCSRDVKAIFESAEKAGNIKVKLVVSESTAAKPSIAEDQRHGQPTEEEQSSQSSTL